MRTIVCFSLVCLSLLCLCAARPAHAANPSQAMVALETSVNRILGAIKNPNYINPATRAPLRQQIEDEVLHIFDFSEFSARTVGAPWRGFNDNEKKRFSDAFANLLLITYLNKIDGYNGEQVIFTGEKASTAGDRVEISSSVTMKDGKKVPVAYRMMKKDSAWRVYDVIIEGVSLVKTYRTQFQDILHNGNADALIQRVNQKVKELQGA